jgi:predicted phage terminase large subunit-like protein
MKYNIENPDRVKRYYDIIQDKKDAAEKHLIEFTKLMWPVIERTPFVDNWHLHVMAEHLEAVANGEITRLLINVPPGMMKSILCCVMYPTWAWLKDSSKRFLTGSHSRDLAIRDTTKSRDIILSDIFHLLWPDKFFLKGDVNQKLHYANNNTGDRRGFGFRAKVTGHKCTDLMIDDAHDAMEAMYSEAERAAVIYKYNNTLYSRLNDLVKSSITIIGQRVHLDDIFGHVIKQEEWEHVILPMSYDKNRVYSTSLSRKRPELCDPRKEDGELLFPERFPARELEIIKNNILGVYGTAAQFEQNPVPLGGGIVKEFWFKERYRALPDQPAKIIQAWDTAQKAKEITHCPWVCGTWYVIGNKYYLADVHREWMEYPTGKARAIELAAKWNVDIVIIEDKSSGSSLIQDLRNETKLNIRAFEPKGDKITRLSTESLAIESGKVILPDDAPWLFDFIQEVTMAPNASYMDQCDMLSMFLCYERHDDIHGKTPWIEGTVDNW